MFERNAHGARVYGRRTLALGTALIGMLGPTPLFAKTPGVEAPPDARALKTQRHLVSVGAYAASFATAKTGMEESFTIGGRVTYLPYWYFGAEIEGGTLRTLDSELDSDLVVL